MKHLAILLVLPFLLTATASAQNFSSAQLNAADNASGDYFGTSVSISGSRAIVGAYLDSTPAGNQAGSATVFERNADGTWSEVVKLTASDAAAQDQFGIAVSLEGDRVVVGSRQDDNANGVNAGAAYIFERNGAGAWLQVAKVRANGGQALELFGSWVVLTGDRLFVGAPDANLAAGLVYIFERNGAGQWSQVASFGASDASQGNLFGKRLSASGDRLLVGASSGDVTPGSNTGAAYVFERDAFGVWNEVVKLTASDAAPNDQFGAAVALVNDCALVGAYDDNHAGGTDAGSVYVFDRDASGVWNYTAKLIAADAAAGDGFGFSLDFKGDLAVVGTPWDDNPMANSGSFHLYRRDVFGTFTPIGKLSPSDPVSSGFYAYSVAIDGERVVVGAQNGGPVFGGSAYAYRVCDGCATPYGTGTAGCAGVQDLTAMAAPEIGMASFGFACTNAPPSSLGLGLVADAQDLTGSDLFGIGAILHVNLLTATEVLTFDLTSDAAGTGSVAAPIPNSPILIGKTYFAQAIWAWASCPLPPYGLSSSAGLSIQILTP